MESGGDTEELPKTVNHNQTTESRPRQKKKRRTDKTSSPEDLQKSLLNQQTTKGEAEHCLDVVALKEGLKERQKTVDHSQTTQSAKEAPAQSKQPHYMKHFNEQELKILKETLPAHPYLIPELATAQTSDYKRAVEEAKGNHLHLTQIFLESDDLMRIVYHCLSLCDSTAVVNKLPLRNKPHLTIKTGIADLFRDLIRRFLKIPWSPEIAKSMIRIIDLSSKRGCIESYYLTYAELYKYLGLLECTLNPAEEVTRTEEDYRRGIEQCHRHWIESYVGDLPNALLQQLVYWSGQEIYSRFMPIMNSSGVGKSKCVDQLGNIGPLVVSVVLRSGQDSGYPPGDPELYDFFRRFVELEHFWQSNVFALAFVVGTFKAMKKWAIDKMFITADADGSLQRADDYSFAKLTERWRKDMAPVTMAGDEKWEPDKLAEFISKTRSPERKEFIKDLIRFMEASYTKLNKPSLWKSAQNKDADFSEEPKTKKRIKRLGRFIETLLPRSTRNNAELIVLSIDEAGVLFDSPFQNSVISKTSGLLYYNIRRIFSAMLAYPVWCIPLSTKSNIVDLVPPRLRDPSKRMRKEDTLSVAPFTIFPMDVIMRERLRSNRQKELKKSLDDFSYLLHLKSMGRILWDTFNEGWSVYSTNGYILEKLLSISPTAFSDSIQISADKATREMVRQCFAVMASRISLDDCSNTSDGAELIRNSILSHLRLLKSFDPILGTAVSVTPSEPLVAQAVSGMLHQKKLWSYIIGIVARKLFHLGLVSKGTKGEFYVLLVLILARDDVVRPILSPVSSPNRIHSSTKSGKGPKMPAAEHFTLKALLEALLKPEYFEQIWNVTKSGSESKETMGDAFKNAKLNFSHWTNASEHLYGDKVAKETSYGASVRLQQQLLKKNELLHLMLYRQAGLIMAANQPEWDAALSMYLGDEDKGIDTNKLSCLFIQTKNEKAGYTPSKDKKTNNYYTNFSHFNVNPKTPVLGLIFNIGYDQKKDCYIKQLQHEAENVWYFDIRGSGSDIFQCLAGGENEKLASACKDLLEVLMPESKLPENLHKMVRTYEPFSRITFAGQAGEEEKVRD